MRGGARECVGPVTLCAVCALAVWYATTQVALKHEQETPVYDFVVVGGGSTGSVVAARLGQEGFSVLVLEAGGATQKDLGGDGDETAVADKFTIFDVPLGWMQVLSDHRWSDEYKWNVPADPTPAIARGLGGCGIHNAMLYMRGRPADFHAWGANWSWKEVLPFYLKSEDNVDHPRSELHHRGGPVRVTRVWRDVISDAFVRACASAGLALVDDFNGAGARQGAGAYQFMIRDGVRDSAATAYLGHGRRPALVSIKTRALATRVLFDDAKRAVGVEYVRGKAPLASAPRLRVLARREVIVSAGAINSPKLLLLSGIGDAAALRKLGIDPVQDNPNVGRGLADGVYAIMQWATTGGDFVKCRLGGTSSSASPRTSKDRRRNNSGSSKEQRKKKRSSSSSTVSEEEFCAQQVRSYISGNRTDSLLGSPGMSAGAFLRSPYARSQEPDVQLTLHPWDKYSRTWRDHYGDIASVEIANNHPRSRGFVALRSAHFSDPPRFQGPYLLDANDSLPLMWAMRQLRRIVRQPALRAHIQRELLPGEDIRTDSQLFDAISCGPAQFRSLGRPACDRSELPVNHLAGTCRLGASPAHAVVDARLRVFGLRGLRVADASVIPQPPSGNTHATCVMIGERAAKFIAEDNDARGK